MKRDFRRLVALAALLVGLVIAGCKHEPSPPTEDGCDRGVEKYAVVKPHSEAELVIFKEDQRPDGN